MLSTKVVTEWCEEVTIPNTVLVGGTSVNYTRLADDEGAVVTATVTVGYDAPWRQVHALLLLAAERTTGVRKNRPPARAPKGAGQLLRRILFGVQRGSARRSSLGAL